MPDKFDAAAEPPHRHNARSPSAARHARRQLVPRLIARLYGSADQSLRATLLACLVRPLGSLGLAAIAAGAFARLLLAADKSGASIGVDEAARFSTDQIVELARFVEQVSPETLHRFAGLIAASPLSAAAFSTSAVMLLLRVLPGPARSVAARKIRRPERFSDA